MFTTEFTQSLLSCTDCQLSSHRSTVVIGDVIQVGGLCFIGEAPGYNEDRQGRPFVGRSGKLLDQMLDYVKIGRNNVNVLNIVKCRPPNNRTPTNEEMNYCGDKWLIQQIKILKPDLIVTLGSVALRYFFPKARMTSAKGKPLFHEKLQLTVFPLFHPSYILRNGNKLNKDYERDFEVISKLLVSGNPPNKSTRIRNDTNSGQQRSLEDFF